MRVKFHAFYSKGIGTLKFYLVECAQVNGTGLEPIPLWNAKFSGPHHLKSLTMPGKTHARIRHQFQIFPPRWLKVPKNK